MTTYAKDLSAVEKRGTALEDAIEPLFQSYVSYYGKKNVFLEISREGQPLNSSIQEDNELIGITQNQKAPDRVMSTVKSNGKEYISVSGALPAPYDA
ncbi:MAG: hypothetical protein ACYDG2_14515, partial [Ruminiclostridium sp.]